MALVLLGAVTVSVCEAGVDPPAIALNVKPETLNVSGPPDVVEDATFRVTAAVCVAEAVTMEIVPLHWVPAAMPDGLTETVKVVLVRLAVKLPSGERASQVLVVQLCSDTWAVALVLLCAVTVSVCEAGVAPPTAALNVKLEALSVSGPDVAAVTFRVTVAVCVAEAVTMETVPLHWVPAAIPD